MILQRVSLTRSWSVKEHLGDNLPTIGFAWRARARFGCVARTAGGTWQPWRRGGAFYSIESGSSFGIGKPGTRGVVDATGKCVWRATAGYAGGGSEHAGRIDSGNSGGAGNAGQRGGRLLWVAH